MNNKFLKPPLSNAEKEKRAESFLNFSTEKDIELYGKQDTQPARVMKKEPIKIVTVRLPNILADNITEIAALTGLSFNSVCLELLRKNTEQKLKEFKT